MRRMYAAQVASLVVGASVLATPAASGGSLTVVVDAVKGTKKSVACDREPYLSERGGGGCKATGTWKYAMRASKGSRETRTVTCGMDFYVNGSGALKQCINMQTVVLTNAKGEDTRCPVGAFLNFDYDGNLTYCREEGLRVGPVR